MDDRQKDQVVCLRYGHYEVMVDGKLYGTWATREIAEAGLRVEQRRGEARKDRDGH